MIIDKLKIITSNFDIPPDMIDLSIGQPGVSLLPQASLAEAAELSVGFAEAVNLVNALTGFVGEQTGLKSELKSMEFIEKLKNGQPG